MRNVGYWSLEFLAFVIGRDLPQNHAYVMYLAFSSKCDLPKRHDFVAITALNLNYLFQMHLGLCDNGFKVI